MTSESFTGGLRGVRSTPLNGKAGYSLAVSGSYFRRLLILLFSLF
jgi:hypothetical protein